MKRTPRRKLLLFAMAVSIAGISVFVGRQMYLSSPSYGLPYHAKFTPEEEDRWTGLGGTWEVADGAMRNDSNEHGAKLLTGSPNWKDYVVEGDFELLGAGTVGVLARVSEAEVGENSFKGYFAAVRTGDNSFLLGVYDFAYHEAAKLTLPDPVRPFRWYHVKLKVQGCQIDASLSSVGIREIKTKTLNDPDCFRTGNIGFRSNNTGGVWRNVTVSPIRPGEAPSVDASAPSPRVPAVNTVAVQADNAPAVQLQSINSLFYAAPFGSPSASVRGSVILTKPALYVQDSTAAVEVQPDSATHLKLGDEVEVTGEVNLEKFSPVIRKAHLRLLREGLPLSPLVVTANQVAEASYDGRFVQVEGYLRGLSTANDGSVTMDLDAGSQSFHAIAPPGRSRFHMQRLQLQSRLRLKGVSLVDPRFNKAADPFVLLVRSAEDVEVAANPPWWGPSTLIFGSLIALGLIFAFNYLYLLLKHWRLRAVTEERERLAHEIHDTLAQSFAGIGFQLQAIRNSMPSGAHVLERQVDLAMSMARTSHEEARRSIASLRPESLGHIELVPALRACAERMVKNGNVTVETYGEDTSRMVPPRIKDTLYRIGQEAIANSIRHACPGIIRIRLQQQSASVCLSVEDDGAGFVAGSDRAGFGLLGMRKRAESISATLVIRSSPGQGTRVEVKAAVRTGLQGRANRGLGLSK